MSLAIEVDSAINARDVIADREPGRIPGIIGQQLVYIGLPPLDCFHVVDPGTIKTTASFEFFDRGCAGRKRGSP
jgi:hypothetical protein